MHYNSFVDFRLDIFIYRSGHKLSLQSFGFFVVELSWCQKIALDGHLHENCYKSAVFFFIVLHSTNATNDDCTVLKPRAIVFFRGVFFVSI